MLKQELNNLATNRKVTVRWIRAHVGYYGNELADEQAKIGSELPTNGPSPLTHLSKSQLNNLIAEHSTKEWHSR